MELLKGVGILVSALVFSYVLAAIGFPYHWYLFIIGDNVNYSGFFAGYAVLGVFFLNMIATYALLIPLLFSTLNFRKKYWWIAILLLPLLIFSLWLGDVALPLIPAIILAAIVGWGIGVVLHKLILKFRKIS